MELVYVKGGCYEMGSNNGEDDEKPPHEVCLSGFYMGRYEVTQSQWIKVMGSNPSYFKDCGGDCPVEQVSWDDVQEFIRKLNSMEGGARYRLPTEESGRMRLPAVEGMKFSAAGTTLTK